MDEEKNTQIMRPAVSDCMTPDAEIERLSEEIEVVAEMVKSRVKDNASAAQSHEEYTKKHNAPVKRYEKATSRVGRTERRADTETRPQP